MVKIKVLNFDTGCWGGEGGEEGGLEEGVRVFVEELLLGVWCCVVGFFSGKGVFLIGGLIWLR